MSSAAAFLILFLVRANLFLAASSSLVADVRGFLVSSDQRRPLVLGKNVVNCDRQGVGKVVSTNRAGEQSHTDSNYESLHRYYH